MEENLNYSGLRKHFSRAQRELILKEHTEQGIPISQLARKNGIHAITIYQWKRKMDQDNDAISPEKIRELLLENSKLKSENKLLKNKIADLAVSNDILHDAIEISKKRELLKQAQLLEQSKKAKNTK